MAYIDTLIEKFPIRKNKAQKETFRTWLQEEAARLGYTAQVEKKGSNNNVIVGDAENAEAIFTANLERFKFQPYGLEGGGKGREGRLIIISGGERRVLGSKVNNLRLKRGDIVRLETSGGGGYGNPVERSAEARARDAALGYVA